MNLFRSRSSAVLLWDENVVLWLQSILKGYFSYLLFAHVNVICVLFESTSEGLC